jgi:phosphate transport system substrate-binding protein
MKSKIFVGNLNFWWILLLLFPCSISCNNASTKTVAKETIHSGEIHISVDESFKPVMDAQIQVFESSFPNAKINVHYKAEAECLKDMLNDSIRLIITTRQLTDNERDAVKSKLQFAAYEGRLAYDAVAVIVNKNAADTAFTMNDIADLAKGGGRLKYKLVLDGLSATSTVRYVNDSLARGTPLGKNVLAAPNTMGVVQYIGNNTDAIGMVGLSWVANIEDTVQQNYLRNVKIAAIDCALCEPVIFIKPYQSNIVSGKYPMVRGLYYILKENYNGLGSGLVDFLIYERGQLIFRRAYLWPGRMNFNKRDANINEK